MRRSKTASTRCVSSETILLKTSLHAWCSTYVLFYVQAQRKHSHEQIIFRFILANNLAIRHHQGSCDTFSKASRSKETIFSNLNLSMWQMCARMRMDHSEMVALIGAHDIRCACMLAASNEDDADIEGMPHAETCWRIAVLTEITRITFTHIHSQWYSHHKTTYPDLLPTELGDLNDKRVRAQQDLDLNNRWVPSVEFVARTKPDRHMAHGRLVLDDVRTLRWGLSDSWFIWCM
jgi:hypothetical protein